MSVVHRYNSFIAVAVAVLVLSSMACSLQVGAAVPTTVPTTVVMTPKVVTTVSTTPFTTVWTALVKLPVVNVREKPSGKVVGTVSVGDSVTIASCSGDWCQIVKPIKGYIFKGCLSVESDLGCQAK